VVYLHSALAKDRIQAAGRQERQTLLIYSKWDCNTGLGIAGLVNLSMLCIAAALFHKPGMTDMSDLGPIHPHLGTLVGGGAALAFGIALMASGLSSSSVGTYAGQIVMAGFMNWLYRVQIAGHYCTNRAAKPRGAPARQKIWPETPEQRVLTVSADLGTLFGKISRAHRLPGYNGRYGIRELCTYARRASWIAVRDHRERAHRQAYRLPNSRASSLALAFPHLLRSVRTTAPGVTHPQPGG
jgi:Natural resistance-associated macrophage protein